MQRLELPPRERARGVTAVLGPTNTGKTHLAIERMLGHESGLIGLPLRLLAREVYGRVVDRVGEGKVALVTGEEKIKPPGAKYWVATVEAMPRDLGTAFVAIDEIQLVADLDRGHVFTDRLLNMRGYAETLVIGASTMKPLVESLLPGVNVVSRPRLSKLTFAGEKKITRLPRRSAVVAFSVEEVYAVAELIRRQSGGAAVVLGALSPRTRNAQVQLYQSGDVDYLVATDAIGMGLNLDVDHVAFASASKFDGFGFRRLNPAEIGQIAGRAGRYMRDGSFGTTGRCDPFEPELIQRLEDHAFEPVRIAQWRNTQLDFRSLASLHASLARTPDEPGLTRAPPAADLLALEAVSRDAEVRAQIRDRASLERLWEVCAVPDYRKVSPAAHAELVATMFLQLQRDGRVSDDWFDRQVKLVDRPEGEIDTLSARIAQVRSWTYVANRPDWLGDPEHWQGVTRGVEDRLSDALHERLASRFVDRRTSVLMRRLRENAMLEAEVNETGDVLVEGQHVGRLHGFQFAPDPAAAAGPESKALRAAAAKALAGEIERRAGKLASAEDGAFLIASDGVIRWTGEIVAKLQAGDRALTPTLRLVADEGLTGAPRDAVQERLDRWLKAHVARLLGPLLALEAGEGLGGLARGIAFQIGEALGVLERAAISNDVRALDQESRGSLRKLGVRFGAYHLTVPLLLKPAPRALAVALWALKNADLDAKGVAELPGIAASGRTSIAVDPEIGRDLYRAAGFRVCGTRAVRVDILERLADLIRPAIAYRPGVTPGAPAPGTADGEGFVVTPPMTSLVGCSGEDFASILRSLGYVADHRPGPAITRALVPAPRVIQYVPPGASEGEASAVAGGALAADPPLAGDEAGGAASSAPLAGSGHGGVPADAALGDAALAGDAVDIAAMMGMDDLSELAPTLGESHGVVPGAPQGAEAADPEASSDESHGGTVVASPEQGLAGVDVAQSADVEPRSTLEGADDEAASTERPALTDVFAQEDYVLAPLDEALALSIGVPVETAAEAAFAPLDEAASAAPLDVFASEQEPALAPDEVAAHEQDASDKATNHGPAAALADEGATSLEPAEARMPAEDAPAEDAPTQDAPAQDASAQDASADGAPTGDARADDAVAEPTPPELIEVWRPSRQQREGGRPPRRQEGEGSRREGRGRGERPGAQPRRNDRPAGPQRGERLPAVAGEAGAAQAQPSAAAGDVQGGELRPEGRRESRGPGRGEGRGPGRGQGREGSARESFGAREGEPRPPRFDGPGRPPRRPDDRAPPRPAFQPRAEERRERPADPNSPFAALAALKDRLTKKD